MSLLDSYINTLTCSKPVFDLTIEKRYDGFNIVPVINSAALQQNKPISGDPLSEIVCGSFIEKLNLSSDPAEFFLLKEDIRATVVFTIMGRLRELLVHYMELKKPDKSLLYKSLCKSPTSERLDAIVLIYQYIKPKLSNEMRLLNETDKPHIKNTISLLMALMEKYDKK